MEQKRLNRKALFETLPVWQAILKLALPSVAGQIILVIYNMADAFFVGLTGSDEKKLREDMRPDALEAFRTQKAVEKIAQLEDLTVTDEEMNAAIERICADNHMSAEDLKPYFDNGFLTVVRQQMLRDKATEVVRRSAQITQ